LLELAQDLAAATFAGAAVPEISNAVGSHHDWPAIQLSPTARPRWRLMLADLSGVMKFCKEVLDLYI